MQQQRKLVLSETYSNQNQALLCSYVSIFLTFQKSFICNNSWKMVVICIRHPHFNSFDDQSKHQVVVEWPMKLPFHDLPIKNVFRVERYLSSRKKGHPYFMHILRTYRNNSTHHIINRLLKVLPL